MFTNQWFSHQFSKINLKIPGHFLKGNNQQQLCSSGLCGTLNLPFVKDSTTPFPRDRQLPFAAILPLLFISGQVYSLINISCLTRGIRARSHKWDVVLHEEGDGRRVDLEKPGLHAWDPSSWNSMIPGSWRFTGVDNVRTGTYKRERIPAEFVKLKTKAG